MNRIEQIVSRTADKLFVEGCRSEKHVRSAIREAVRPHYERATEIKACHYKQIPYCCASCDLVAEFAPLFEEEKPKMEETSCQEPHLGLATTAQLLRELEARAEIRDYKQYRTAESARPK